MENQEMTTEMMRGKKKVIFLIVSIIVFSIASQIIALATFKQFTVGRFYLAILRLLLEIGLLWAVYSGRAWARYVSVFIFSISLIFILVFSIPLIKASLLGLVMFPVFILYGYALYLLLWDKDFLSFFEYQIENSY